MCKCQSVFFGRLRINLGLRMRGQQRKEHAIAVQDRDLSLEMPPNSDLRTIALLSYSRGHVFRMLWVILRGQPGGWNDTALEKQSATVVHAPRSHLCQGEASEHFDKPGERVLLKHIGYIEPHQPQQPQQFLGRTSPMPRPMMTL